MGREVFVDTWGWITLRNQREPRHAEIQQWYQAYRNSGSVIVTTDFVLDESYTLLYKRLPPHQAADSIAFFRDAVQAGYLRLERISAARWERAEALRLQLQDKPRISFTDLTSMVVMEKLTIQRIVTGDAHFTHVGKGFQAIPAPPDAPRT